MKIIDLLNKIANGEEVPKKILHDGNEYSYVERNRMFAKYIREPFNARLPDYLFTDIVNIEDEVEIIEEDNKIEKLDTWFSMKNVQNNGMSKEDFIIKYADYNFETYFNKINEIIDYINKEHQ